MKDFTERFDEMLDFIGVSAYKLAKELGTSSSVISTIRSGKNKPSFDFLSKLVSKYELINIDYLLTGKGEINKNTIPSKELLPYDKKGDFASKNASPTASPTLKRDNKKGKEYTASQPDNMLILNESGVPYGNEDINQRNASIVAHLERIFALMGIEKL